MTTENGIASEESSQQRTNAPLERATVNLTARTTFYLNESMRRTGDSKTDIINRAIVRNSILEAAVENGAVLYIKEASGDMQRIMFL